MTSTFLGPAEAPGTLPRTPAIHRSTLRRHPSGCALTQMNPRDRRLMICCGIVEIGYGNPTPPRCPLSFTRVVVKFEEAENRMLHASDFPKLSTACGFSTGIRS